MAGMQQQSTVNLESGGPAVPPDQQSYLGQGYSQYPMPGGYPQMPQQSYNQGTYTTGKDNFGYGYDSSLPGYTTQPGSYPGAPPPQGYYGQQGQAGGPPGTYVYTDAYGNQTIYQQPGYTQWYMQGPAFNSQFGDTYLGNFWTSFGLGLCCGMVCPIWGPMCLMCFTPTPRGKAGVALAFGLSLILWGSAALAIYPAVYGDFSVQSCVDYYAGKTVYVAGGVANEDQIRHMCENSKSASLWVGCVNLIFGIILFALGMGLKVKVDKLEEAMKARRQQGGAPAAATLHRVDTD